MKALLLFLLLVAIPGSAQELELTPGGFAPVTIAKPSKTNEKFIEKARSWAISVNSDNQYPYDVYDVTENSFKIDAHRENAFFYRNRGEAYFHRIKYTMAVVLSENAYTVNFTIKEIHTSNRLTEMTVADLYTAEGKLKDDYLDAEPSLEKTVNSIIRSFASFVETN